MSSVVRFKKRASGAIIEGVPGQAPPEPPNGGPEDDRVRQQELLTELGLLALKGTPFLELLEHTARLTAEGLRAEFCKVMEYLPETNRLLVRAGVGWGPGVVGSATVGADLESPAGYALQTGAPVLSNHLDNEERFRTPELLVEYGIQRAINVILQGSGKPYGVLEVDSRSEGEFSERDIVFLQGAANLLGMAIERQRIERDLRTALDRHRMLLAEVNHRVNNSLQIVGSLMHLQSRTTESAEVKRHLREASNRIAAIARAHQRLYQTDEFSTLDLAAYLTEVCTDLIQALPGTAVELEASEHVVVSTDKAILVALLINELVTNVAKYAYPGQDARAWVSLERRGERVRISVRDEGVGLPPGFDLKGGSGLGMRLIETFVSQLRAQLEVSRREPGTEFSVTIPLA